MRNSTMRPLLMLLAAGALGAASQAALAQATPAGTAGAAAAPNATASVNQLATQARYWEGKGRYDLAREAWLKLLRVSPNNADALAGLASAEANSGRASRAQTYLDQLRKAHPNDPRVFDIQASIRQGSFDSSKLTQPRAFARQGKYAEAVQAYRAAYGNQIPGGRLGLEYYQTLAGTDTGWDEARKGIEKLAAENASDPVYRLALAQHLTYREESRRQGIASLSSIADQPAVSARARAAWRQALLWLGVKPGDEELYRGYLRRYGEDPQVSAKLAAGRSGGGGGTTTAGGTTAAPPASYVPTADDFRARLNREGFAALDNNQIELAEQKFNQSIGQYGQSADALGGLGVIKLRREDYSGARELLQRASQLAGAGGSGGRWADALSTARFWETVRAAEAARRVGNNTLAEQEYRRAIAIDPKRAGQEPSVPVSLADVLVEMGKPDEAEKFYRDAYRQHPNNADAFRGMLSVLARNGKLAEAAAMADAAPEALKAKLGGVGAIKAQYLRFQADEAFRAGNDPRAEQLLKQALVADPESPWTRLQLAGVYQRQGRIRDANTLVDGLLATGSAPVRPEALFVKASLLSEQQHPYEALLLLEQIPPGERTPAMARLQKQVWIRYQADRAALYARYGQSRQAASLVAAVEPYVAEMPELTGTVASVYADLGDSSRALTYVRQAMKRSSSPDIGLRIQYAGLLFRLRQDAEFAVVMEDLAREQRLNAQQRADYDNLRIGYRLRQADLMREDGDLGTAYESLQPLLAAQPQEPRLQMALARLYSDAKDYEQAHDIYRRVLERNPRDLDAYKGAIDAALALDEVNTADALLERALAVAPNDARLYALAGRSAKLRGDEGRALELFNHALRLDAQRNSAGSTPGNMGSQPLLQIIDPQPQVVQPLPGAGRSYGALPGLRKMSSKPDARFRPMSPRRESLPSRKPGLVKAVHHPIVPAALSGITAGSSRYGDITLPAAGQRRFAALVKTSTRPAAKRRAPRKAPARSAAATAATAEPMSDGGYWTEERDAGGNLSYRYVEPSNPAPAEAAAPGGGEPTAAGRSGSSMPVPSRPTGRASVADGAGSMAAPSYGLPSPPVSKAVTPAFPPAAPMSRAESEYWRLPATPTAPPPPVAEVMPQPQPLLPPATEPVDPLAEIKRNPLRRGRGFTPDRQAEPTPERRELLAEINELGARRGAYAAVGVSGRSRDGRDGLDRLDNVELPLEFAFPATAAGRLSLRVVPVHLESGTVSGSDLGLFGLGAAFALDPDASPRFDVRDNGVAVGLGYDLGSLHVDVGTSPLGFVVENVVGGVSWQPKLGDTSFRFNASRRSVADSVLSYAGLRDPVLGLNWGGVTKNGLRIDVSQALGRYGVYGNASYHALLGNNVKRNDVIEVGGGVYARGFESRRMRFTYGLNATALHYKRNLRHFSFGHGGYFSPENYFAATIPLQLEGFRNRLSYSFGVSLGFQTFNEEGAALYPNDPSFQQELEDRLEMVNDPDSGMVPLAFDVVTGYSSRRQSGLAAGVDARVEYLLDPNLSLGGRFAFDDARDYNEVSGIGYLRYHFTGQPRVGSPPWVLQPAFNFGDPRL